MTLWIALSVMSLLATLFVAVPLYRNQQKLSALAVAAIVFVVAGSAGLYARQGSPNLPSAEGGGSQQDLASLNEVVAALAERLEREPGDLEGWKMLGRSYMNTQDFAGAVDAFERANAIESSTNAQTLVELGEALLARDNAPIAGRVANLFESALTIDSANPQALFYGGIGAMNSGNQALAADRWEALLAQNPPDEIRHVLEQRIAEWRGEAPAAMPAPAPAAAEAPAAMPAPAPAAAEAAPAPASDGDYVVSAAVSVSATAAAALPAEAIVFVIARDPGQPSPPIAVKRLRLSELPARIDLNDGDSMMAGRQLSGFAEVELVARVSLSGGPAQQSGDWFGSAIVKPEESSRVDVAIDQQVP